jgi:hypothetical protein
MQHIAHYSNYYYLTQESMHIAQVAHMARKPQDALPIVSIGDDLICAQTWMGMVSF